MRHHFTLILLLFVIASSFGAKAQNNLQFTEAKYIHLACSECLFVTETITVPENKVWKIESAG